jgi:hypothetical protein
MTANLLLICGSVGTKLPFLALLWQINCAIVFHGFVVCNMDIAELAVEE